MKKIIEELIQTNDCLSFVVSHLREANKQYNPVYSLILIPLIKEAKELRDKVNQTLLAFQEKE